jgi:hypothetical protein
LNDYSFFSAPQLKRDPLGSDMEIVLYLALGAIFAFAAGRILKKGGMRQLALMTFAATLILLVLGVWLENKTPPSETAMGFPILLALLSPALSAAVVWGVSTSGSSVFLQVVVGTFAWAFGFLITSIAGLALNWITF